MPYKTSKLPNKILILLHSAALSTPQWHKQQPENKEDILFEWNNKNEHRSL
jgi:hypothetical protein